MYFTRYEIRWIIHRSFYEGGDTFEYIPFDTLEEAKRYIKEHMELCKGSGLYKVRLYSTYDIPELIKEL